MIETKVLKDELVTDFTLKRFSPTQNTKAKIFVYPELSSIFTKEQMCANLDSLRYNFNDKTIFLDSKDFRKDTENLSLYNRVEIKISDYTTKIIKMEITKESLISDILQLISNSFINIFIKNDLFDEDTFKILYRNNIPFNYIAFLNEPRSYEMYFERVNEYRRLNNELPVTDLDYKFASKTFINLKDKITFDILKKFEEMGLVKFIFLDNQERKEKDEDYKGRMVYDNIIDINFTIKDNR